MIVRPDVIAALGQLARGGRAWTSRANACRAIGILRGQAAFPDLIEALRSKDNDVMYESLVAMQKIGDPAAGPQHHLPAARSRRPRADRRPSKPPACCGYGRSADAAGIVANPRNNKAERAALARHRHDAGAADRDLFLRELASKDEKTARRRGRGSGQNRESGRSARVEKAWKDEDKMAPRLAAAFALVMDGKLELSEDSPVAVSDQYSELRPRITTYAFAYLVEAGARKPRTARRSTRR